MERLIKRVELYEKIGFFLHLQRESDFSVCQISLNMESYTQYGIYMYWHNGVYRGLRNSKLLCGGPDSGPVFNNVKGKVLGPFLYISFQHSTLPASCWSILCERGKKRTAIFCAGYGSCRAAAIRLGKITCNILRFNSGNVTGM